MLNYLLQRFLRSLRGTGTSLVPVCVGSYQVSNGLCRSMSIVKHRQKTVRDWFRPVWISRCRLFPVLTCADRCRCCGETARNALIKIQYLYRIYPGTVPSPWQYHTVLYSTVPHYTVCDVTVFKKNNIVAFTVTFYPVKRIVTVNVTFLGTENIPLHIPSPLLSVPHALKNKALRALLHF